MLYSHSYHAAFWESLICGFAKIFEKTMTPKRRKMTFQIDIIIGHLLLPVI